MSTLKNFLLGHILIRNIILACFITLLILILFMIRNKIKNGFLHSMGIVFLVIWMCIVFSLTGVTPLSGFHWDIRLNDISVIPIYGMIKMICETVDLGIRQNMMFEAFIYLTANILGNMILFIPVGFLTPLLFQKIQKLRTVFIAGLFTSLLIEITQLFLSRGTDVDDLILNTAGCVTGYLFFLLFRKIMPKFFHKFLLESGKKYRLINPGYVYCVIVPYLIFVLLGFIDRFYFFNA